MGRFKLLNSVIDEFNSGDALSILEAVSNVPFNGDEDAKIAALSKEAAEAFCIRTDVECVNDAIFGAEYLSRSLTRDIVELNRAVNRMEYEVDAGNAEDAASYLGYLAFLLKGMTENVRSIVRTIVEDMQRQVPSEEEIEDTRDKIEYLRAVVDSAVEEGKEDQLCGLIKQIPVLEGFVKEHPGYLAAALGEAKYAHKVKDTNDLSFRVSDKALAQVREVVL